MRDERIASDVDRHCSGAAEPTLLAGWRAKAACLGEDPELFFPIGTTGPALEQTQRAKAVCARCTARPACLQWAVNTGQDAGVWGGKSEDERRNLRRALRRRAVNRATS